MNENLKNLLEKSKSNDFTVANNALSDLGLLVERHTQNRYSEKDYLLLLDNNEELYNLKLTDSDVDVIVSFFFDQILNGTDHGVTLAWCLGKCYHLDIFEGMKKLLTVYDDDDDVTLQLLYSINALFGLDTIKPKLLKIKNRKDLPNTKSYLDELEANGFFGSVLN